MTKLIAIAATTVSLGKKDLPIDCYMINKDEFRVSITGVSVILGYRKEWFLTLPSDLTKLRALEKGGFKYTHEPVFIQNSDRGKATEEQTISITDFTTLITLEALSENRLEALSGNKRAIALQAAFTLGGLDALFRDAFKMPQKSQEEMQSFFRKKYDQFLEVFEKNPVKLAQLRLPNDDHYFTKNKAGLT
jgi:hypothetical protein